MNKQENNSNKDAGKKSEKSVNKDKDHKADIGRKGGSTVSKDKEHMADARKEVKH